MASAIFPAGGVKRFLPRNLRLSDGFILGCPIAFIALLIVPMPASLLDLFIAANLTAGVMLLLAAIYVTKPLDFSTFPSVLLLTTLFRLGIAVATTRAILTEAHAGRIVEQFGQMVAGGQVLVGFVVFLIIVVVQLIVIAKGAERVAEVGARFSLDAMPGKQLSIDSDLRSGLLSKGEARAKRRELELESKFHGSLDGAMKFVKGDAIATVVIILINLIGGMAVGVLHHDMDFATAAATFSILTIGDGLVSQLPAFFSAIAAGLLVTRTTDEETDRHLGPAIARQLWGQPHVLMIAAAITTLLAFVPGFPVVVFLLLSVALLGAGLWTHPTSGGLIRARLASYRNRPDPVPDEIQLRSEPLAMVDPLSLRLIVTPDQRLQMSALPERIEQAVKSVQARTGVKLPALALAIASNEDPGVAGSWQLSAFDAPIGMGQANDLDALPDAIDSALCRNLSLFLGLQEVTDMLNWLGETYPEVVKEAVRAVPTGAIAEVFRALADEQVPLRNLRDIVEAIAEAGQVEQQPLLIAERVRVAMRRHIIAGLTQGGRLRVLMVGAALEEAIRATLTVVNDQTRLAIDPIQMQALIGLIREEAANSGASALLTAQDLRRPLRLIVAPDMFHLPVIAFNELSPTVPLDVAGELKLLAELAPHPVLEAAE